MINLIENYFLKNSQGSSKIIKKALRKRGMKIGDNTTFYRDFWCWAEPYLIEVGRDCQITAGVKAFTHGGALVARETIPTFDTFGKVKIGNFTYI